MLGRVARQESEDGVVVCDHDTDRLTFLLSRGGTDQAGARSGFIPARLRLRAHVSGEYDAEIPLTIDLRL